MSKEWKIYENEVYEECCRIYGEEKVERNIFRKGVSSRTPRQIDVLVHTEEGDIAFDAKYYSEHVDVKKIDEMAGMYADLGVSKFVVVTTKGYSEAALNRAYYGNENVEADILSMEELKLLQGYLGLVRVGQSGVFICAPFSWVLDVQKSAHPQMPYVLYRRGLTYKQALEEEHEIAYVWIEDKEDCGCLADLIAYHKESGLQADRGSEWQQIEDSPYTIRRFKHSQTKIVEYYGYREFDDFIFYVVILCEEEKWNRNKKKMEYMLEHVIPAHVEEQIDVEAWRELVRNSKTGTWFQSPEACEFYASMPELFKPFVYHIENDGELRGVCVGYVTEEKNAVKQMMTRRAIVIGGPCLADDCSDAEVEMLMKAVRKELKGEAIYVESRNFNDYSKWKDAFAAAGFEYVPHLNFHVDTSSVEVVEANLGKSRKRDIRTSLRDGATIIEHPTLEQVRDYYAILEHLYKTRVKTPLFPFSFFEKLWQYKDGRFMLVALNNEIIGGTVCVEQEGKCLYEWFACGRDGEWKAIFPSTLATYSGIRYAAEHNCPRFDMMGAGKPDEAYGVRDFKAKFGGKEVEHGRFLCITKPLLYKIGVLGVKIIKTLK